MYKLKQIFAMDLINLLTNPMWVFYAIGFPLALILALGFLASGSFGNAVSSYDYYGVALMAFAIFNAATFSANSFMEERIKSPNMRIIYSPVRVWHIPFSKALATTVFCTVANSIVAAFLHFAFGVNYGGSDSWLLFAIMFAAVFFFSSLGVLVCSIMKSESSANNVVSLALTLFALLGGVFFPVDGLGGAISAASWISPAKWMLAASFRIIYDSDYSMLQPVCATLALLSVASIALCGAFFKGEDYI